MKIQITPYALSGAVAAPVSKSAAHRLLICAALGDRPCVVRCDGTNRDIEATIACLSALGASIVRKGENLHITPIACNGGTVKGATLDCSESGSTLRFLLPVVCALDADATLIGQGRLPSRPLSPLYEELAAHGAKLGENGKMPLFASGKLSAGQFVIDGGVSSQFISGLLFALPLLNEPTEIVVTGKLESARYIDITLDALKLFGVIPQKTATGWAFSGEESYHSPENLSVEGDWSNGAFWLVAGALPRGAGQPPKPLTVSGLNEQSLQGDKAIIPLLEQFGAKVTRSSDCYSVTSSPMKAIRIDASDIPDLVPILSVAAAYAEGKTVFDNIARLRIKESDRVATVIALLKAFDIEAYADEHTLTVIGSKPKVVSALDSFNDHRIAMAAAVAASAAEGVLVMTGAEAVRKSYPDFYDRFKLLGGIAETVSEDN